MLDLLSGEVVQVARDLAIAGICYRAFKLTRDYALAHGSFRAAWRGVAWSAGVALLIAAFKGTGTCVDGDPLFGGCAEMAGRYVPIMASRMATAFYWFVLLAVPVAIGASDWRARMRLGRGRTDA